MLVQIAVLAWIFLGEQITILGIVGLAIAAIGVLLVNLKPAMPSDKPPIDAAELMDRERKDRTGE